MNLAQLKRRLKSIKSIVEITKAMELISAIKLNQIQGGVASQKAFSTELENMFQTLINNEAISNSSHWSINSREKAQNKELIIVFGTERGLCGSLNTQLIRTLNVYNKDKNIELVTVGQKISILAPQLNNDIIAAFSPGFGWKEFSNILPLTSLVFEGFKKGDWNKVSIAYPSFISTLTQKPKIVPFLPLSSWANNENLEQETETPLNLTFEGSKDNFLRVTLPFLLELELWHVNLEANASEQASRFMTMSQAKTNSQDLRDDLSLELNDLRQSQITNSLIESLSVQGS